MRAVENVTGERAIGCPWFTSADPFVSVVSRSHRHWTKGELGTRWGGRVPEALMRGVEVFGGALDAVSAFDIKQMQKPSNQPDPHPAGGGLRIQRTPVHVARRQRQRRTEGQP